MAVSLGLKFYLRSLSLQFLTRVTPLRRFERVYKCIHVCKKYYIKKKVINGQGRGGGGGGGGGVKGRGPGG